MILIVTLERNPIRRMDSFIQQMSAYSRRYRRVMSNVWLVDTDYSANELAVALTAHIQKTDALFVMLVLVRSEYDYGGYFDSEAADWIRAAGASGAFITQPASQTDGELAVPA